MEIVSAENDHSKQNLDEHSIKNRITERSNGESSGVLRNKEINKKSVPDKSKYLKYLITVDKCTDENQKTPQESITPILSSSKSFLMEENKNPNTEVSKLKHSTSYKSILKLDNSSGISDSSPRNQKKKVNFNVDEVFFDSTDNVKDEPNKKRRFQSNKTLKHFSLDKIKPYQINTKNSKIKKIVKLLNYYAFTSNSDCSRIYFDDKLGSISGFSVNNFFNLDENQENKSCITTKNALNIKSENNYITENSPENIFNFFSIYEGHNGEASANFLKNQLIQNIISEKNSLNNTFKAILRAFYDCEDSILLKNSNNMDYSGSSALLCIIKNKICHIANLGESRAMCSIWTSEVFSLCWEHKPEKEKEKNRVIENGGSIFSLPSISKSKILKVNPGNLSVTRSLGDINSKLKQNGGLPGVVIAVPDIFSFEITDKFDFILLASSQVFEHHSNKELTILIIECIKESILSNHLFNEMICFITYKIIESTKIKSKSLIEACCIFLCLENIRKIFFFKDIDTLNSYLSFLKKRLDNFEILYDKFQEMALYQAPKQKENYITSETESKFVSSNAKTGIKKESKCSCCILF